MFTVAFVFGIPPLPSIGREVMRGFEFPITFGGRIHTHSDAIWCPRVMVGLEFRPKGSELKPTEIVFHDGNHYQHYSLVIAAINR